MPACLCGSHNSQLGAVGGCDLGSLATERVFCRAGNSVDKASTMDKGPLQLLSKVPNQVRLPPLNAHWLCPLHSKGARCRCTPPPPVQLLINGEWIDAASGKTFPVIDPRTEEEIFRVAEADAEDVEKAVKVGRGAHTQSQALVQVA